MQGGSTPSSSTSPSTIGSSPSPTFRPQQEQKRQPGPALESHEDDRLTTTTVPGLSGSALKLATLGGKDYDESGYMSSERSSDEEDDYEEEGGAKDMVTKALELACNGSTQEKRQKYAGSTDELDLSVRIFTPVSASWHCPYSEHLSSFSFLRSVGSYFKEQKQGSFAVSGCSDFV